MIVKNETDKETTNLSPPNQQPVPSPLFFKGFKEDFSLGIVSNRIQHMKKTAVRFLTNDLITRWINFTYDFYSRIYEGQLRLGIPVSKELLKSREEIRARAASKLALTLYHIFLQVTGIRVPRSDIKGILLGELEAGNLRLTENVIILTRSQLKYLALNRCKIPGYFFSAILEEATRRRILKETLKNNPLPAYFDSEIEENAENGRGDYEFVYYRDYTDEGKEIKFRRIVSIEAVTAGDNRPSVILVPGFVNNSNCYNLSNKQSLAKDMADQGHWVYLFDPRGMGINQGKFDPWYTVDTLIDYDLPTVLRFINSRSKKKPSILIGHSMGGIIAENMVLNWSVRKHLNHIDDLSVEQKAMLNQLLPPADVAAENLRQVRGIISMGAPKFFNRYSHAFYPTALWLNHLARIFRMRQVPVKEAMLFLSQMPGLSHATNHLLKTNVGDLNFLMCPENHTSSSFFTKTYIQHAIESVPLGLGFQFLKAIYNGEGFKRMDQSRFNYSTHLNYFAKDIPLFHIWGDKDPLATPDNVYYSKSYPHKRKKIYHIESPRDIERIDIPEKQSQVIDFIIENANHLDLLYGRVAEEIVYPLLLKIVEQVWGDWSYEQEADSAA
ncbi:MAG: alpha/beta fold hydrolase [Desulfobacterales bacterium]|nr:alpha/beta fold hydrolase [Desulfobacterales bacterium]